MVTRAQLEAYRARPWATLRTLKDRHVARRVEQLGPTEGLRLSAALLAHAVSLGAVPSAAARAEDLAAAVALRKKLDRAAGRRRAR